MNNKMMLITALAALYAESLLTDPSRDHDVIRKVLLEAKLPEYAEEGDERSALVEIKDIITSIIDGGMTYDHANVMKRLKLATTQVRPLYDTITKFLEDDIPEDPEKRIEHLNRQVSQYYFQLRQCIQGVELKRRLGRAIGTLNGTETRVDVQTALSELKDTLSTFSERSHNKIPSLVGELVTDNRAPFIKVFDSINKKAAGNGLQTGWKSINQMLGCNKGITEEMWLMPALPFNCKSLFSLLLTLSVPIFNTPEKVMADVKGTLQPIILDLSLENELDVNLAYGYQQIYGHFEGEAPRMVLPAEATAEEKLAHTTQMSDYLCGKIQAQGWDYVFQKHTNSDFKVHYINDLILDLKRRGYHVVGIRADYLGTISKGGHGNGVVGSDIKEIYRMARNYQVVRNRGFMIAPHQISPEGKRLKALDPIGFCKSLPGRGLYSDCSSLDNEADGEMYFNKRVVNGHSFLEVQRGKHRTIIDTKEAHHYTVLPFADVGILPWDCDKEETVTASSINFFTGGMGDELFA
ncbi:putative helicase [Erwinia phage vB_EamM_Stratton]|uniref:Putative helicase n=1 Tax=Erwinia phage vB_EamM_Stratton TaxID=1883378 RepID=A0A1B2IGW9_9CAUD|nr:putative helicase [Erwinia phage vB_EamM_Stratton]